ncbi:M20/M25/M40 family metallo-hydrolase [Streptomyces sp. NPDC003362]
MDAVDEDEQRPGEFASLVPGAAHLCGHDLHTAIGVGIAEVLAQLRERLNGRVVLLFQPAEETLAGARAMLEDGVLERTAPQRLADLIDGFSTICYPQSPGEFQQLLEDLRTPAGPLTRFVFARSQLTWTDEHAEVRAWLRAWPDSRYAEIRNELRRAVDALPDAQITFQGQPFPSMVCWPELSEAAAAHLRGVLGAHAVTVLHAAFPFNGEDFALFLQRLPRAMFILGVANPEAGLTGMPHRPDFAADETAIGAGVWSMAGFLASRLRTLA